MAREEALALRGNNRESLVGAWQPQTRRVEILNADRTLTERDGGTLFVVTLAAGLDVVLPTIEQVDIGTTFEFVYTVAVSGTAHTYTAGVASDLYIGGVAIVDFDTADKVAHFAPDVSNDVIMTFGTGGTQGGKIGTRFKFTAITSTRWWVEGILAGDGTLATPFS